MLVLVAERLPIEETARAIEQLEEAGVTIGGLVVNRVLPATSPDPFLRARHEQELVYLDEIDRRFTSHLKVRVPQLASDVHGVKTLEHLAGRADDGESACHHDDRSTADHPSSLRSTPATSARCRTSGPVDHARRIRSASFERLRALPDERGQLIATRAGKWSVKELLGHLCRRRARVLLPAAAHCPRRPDAAGGLRRERVERRRRRTTIAALSEVVDEMIAVRRATLALVDRSTRRRSRERGVANNNSDQRARSVWIMPGHAQHHLDILRERYGVAV